MKVGDLVVYAWNPKERPEEVDLGIVLDMNPPEQWGEGGYVRVWLQVAPDIAPLMVPRWKLSVVGEHHE